MGKKIDYDHAREELQRIAYYQHSRTDEGMGDCDQGHLVVDLRKALQVLKSLADKEIDTGKIQALRKAGWPIKKIADEMRLAEATICRHLKMTERGT